MIVKTEWGAYSGDYIFRSDVEVTRESLEKAITRIRTFLSFDSLYGEILYPDTLRDMYKNNIIKFMQVSVSGTLIKIFSVEIIEDGSDIGLRIVFKPRFCGVEEKETKAHLIKWIETNQMVLLPRMFGSISGNKILHFDIVTFDLVPREGADIDLNEFIHKN